MATSIVNISKSSVVTRVTACPLQIGGEGDPTASMEATQAGTSGFDTKDQLIGSSTFDLNGVEYVGDEFTLGTSNLLAFYGFSGTVATEGDPIVKVIFHSYDEPEASTGSESTKDHDECFVLLYPETSTLVSLPSRFTVGGSGNIARCIYVNPLDDTPINPTTLPIDSFVRSIAGSRCLSESEASTVLPTPTDNLNDLTDGTVSAVSSAKFNLNKDCKTCG